MNQNELKPPHLPNCPEIKADLFGLGEIRDYLKPLPPHEETNYLLKKLFDEWNSNKKCPKPIQKIQKVMNSIRQLPRSEERVAAMNTFVRTLGTASNLASFLDMLRQSANSKDLAEKTLTNYSRLDRQHSSYGWCGQTRLLCSEENFSSGTVEPEDGVQEIIGSAPPSRWSLSMHIWQPNPNAKGFPIGKQPDSDLIFEPPHSHPFDFASMVAIGSLKQTVYSDISQDVQHPFEGKFLENRYDDVDLIHVQRVWPPHNDQSPANLNCQEEVVLLQGDSYFLPCNKIHDVEVDRKTALINPAITLFLRSEAVVIPHVYMVKSMVDFHKKNPDIEHMGQPLQEEDWNNKLKLVSIYLRGESDTLNLAEVVKQKSEYAFFNQ